jgi:hypothetical protein
MTSSRERIVPPKEKRYFGKCYVLHDFFVNYLIISLKPPNNWRQLETT